MDSETTLMEAKLNRRAELAEAAKEYAKLDKEIKKYAKSKDCETLTVGDWLIERSVSNFVTKAQEAKEVTRVSFAIRRIES